MLCPDCRSEYRPGITRCATCNVALVEVLSEAPRREPPKSAPAPTPEDDGEAMASYCGFHTLDEARAARAQLRAKRIVADIVIREGVAEDPAAAPPEEYWLRVPPRQLALVERILGFEPAGDAEEDEEEAEEGEEFACSNCGRDVAANEDVCPNCGARFDE